MVGAICGQFVLSNFMLSKYHLVAAEIISPVVFFLCAATTQLIIALTAKLVLSVTVHIQLLLTEFTGVI